MKKTFTFDYDGLWYKLIDLKMKKKDLQKKAELSSNVIAKMGKGEPVNLEALARICDLLRCELSDLVKLIPKTDKVR